MRTVRDEFRKEDVFLNAGLLKAQRHIGMQKRETNSISNTVPAGEGKEKRFHSPVNCRGRKWSLLKTSAMKLVQER